MLAFFVLFRIIRGAIGENLNAEWKIPVCYVGAITGSLFMSFSNTHWNNAVETEVYGPSMFVIMAVVWLALRWKDTLGTPKADRYLIAIVYVGFASIGIHLTPFMVMPVVFLFIVLVDKALRAEWRFWVTGIVLLTIAYSVEVFGISWLAWSAIAAIAIITAKKKKAWVMVLLLMGVAFAGYSNHLYIPMVTAIIFIFLSARRMIRILMRITRKLLNHFAISSAANNMVHRICFPVCSPGGAVRLTSSVTTRAWGLDAFSRTNMGLTGGGSPRFLLWGFSVVFGCTGDTRTSVFC